VSSISVVRKHGRAPLAASACMYSQCSVPAGSASTRMVGKEWVRWSFSMLFISRILDRSPPDEAWTAAETVPRADATPAGRVGLQEGKNPGKVARKRNGARHGARRGSGGGFVAQLAAQDLADVGLGQLVAELHHVRPLVAGELLARVGLDLLGGEVGVLAHDHDLDHLAGLLVGHADGGDLEDPGHAGEHVLD